MFIWDASQLWSLLVAEMWQRDHRFLKTRCRQDFFCLCYRAGVRQCFYFSHPPFLFHASFVTSSQGYLIPVVFFADKLLNNLISVKLKFPSPSTFLIFYYQ